MRSRAISRAEPLAEAKAGGGMLPGAEAQTGIEYDDGLAGSAPPFAPAWLDHEGRTNGDHLEIFFPGFRPVLAAHAGKPRSTGAGIETDLL